MRIFSLLQSWKAIDMNVPKEVTTYCPKCKKHQAHTVSLYKPGKRRALAKGERHHAREKKGYGGQKDPLQNPFAKMNNNSTAMPQIRLLATSVATPLPNPLAEEQD